MTQEDYDKAKLAVEGVHQRIECLANQGRKVRKRGASDAEFHPRSTPGNDNCSSTETRSQDDQSISPISTEFPARKRMRTGLWCSGPSLCSPADQASDQRRGSSGHTSSSEANPTHDGQSGTLSRKHSEPADADVGGSDQSTGGSGEATNMFSVGDIASSVWDDILEFSHDGVFGFV